jgi:DNA-binding CsgD family transcriptional regulator
VLIRGAEGIGKTAIWRRGIEEHRSAGHRILVTRACEDELHAPMTGLIDLLEDADPHGDLLDRDADVFERGRSVEHTLRRLAAASPVVLAIDDLQWLDTVSLRSLRYALRRLETAPVSVLATERVAGERVTIVPADRSEEMVLGPLSREHLCAAVRAAVGSVPQPLLDRVCELSDGNPLFAIELARARYASDGSPVAMPATLRSTLASRMGAVTPDQLAVLRTAAALGPATLVTLATACDHPAAGSLIADALADELLVSGEDGLVRFAHPLLASVILDGTNPVERMALHARLADVVTDPDSRARHLALSCSGHDAAIAEEIEAAAGRAARWGAIAVAAELATHSIRVTPDNDEEARARRTLAAISYRAAAGEPARALAMTDELLGTLPAGQARSEATTLRVFLDIDDGEQFLARAAAEAGDDQRWRGRLLELRGWVVGTYRGRLDDAVRLGEEAVAIARAEGDEELEMLAAATLSTNAIQAGRPLPDLMTRALDLAERLDPPRLGRWPQLFRARHAIWGGQLDEARQRFEEMRHVFSRRGIEFQRPYRLADLALVEVVAGKLDAAVELTDDALIAAHDAGNLQAVAWHGYPAGLAYAHLGRRADAERLGGELMSWADAHDQPPRRLMAHHVLGIAALARGAAFVAAGELVAGVALADRLGYRHPGYIPVLPDAIEAHALTGDDETCGRLAEQLETQAAVLGLPWVDAAAARGRGLALLAAGDPAAVGELTAAATAFDTLGYCLDAARTQVLVGRALRRGGQRSAAALALDEAHARLTAMHAAGWAEQADAERGRVAPTRAEGTLTPTEARIAALVAEGRRNREIAGELLVSAATVEAHLTRIYRKLGVRSRTELAQAVHIER